MPRRSGSICAFILTASAIALTSQPLLAQDGDSPQRDWLQEWSGEADSEERAGDDRLPPKRASFGLEASVRPRVEARRTGDVVTERTSYRARIGVVAEAGLLSAFLQPQAGGNYGAIGGDDLNDPGLDIHQAYLRYGPDRLNVQVGRFEVTYGEERIFARANWNQVGRAWDAARVHAQLIDGVELDLFGGKHSNFPAVQNITLPAYRFDSYNGTVMLQLREGLLGAALDEADLYVLRDHRATLTNYDGPRRKRLTTMGARIKGKWKPVDLSAEGALQRGSACTLELSDARPAVCVDYEDEIDVRAAMGEVELGVRPIKPMRIELGGIYASGDRDPDDATDNDWDTLYTAAHRHLGLADIIRRRDVVEARLGLTHDHEKWSFGLGAHYFWTAALDARGAELDLGARYKPAKPLTVALGLSRFQAAATSDDDHVTWAYLQAVATFE